eukprot:scaffold54939_cov48-Phaeocystis_antarctica.AAC.1
MLAWLRASSNASSTPRAAASSSRSPWRASPALSAAAHGPPRRRVRCKWAHAAARSRSAAAAP